MKNQFVNATQIRTMHNAGMTIGAHTVNHPILLNESDSVARTEIAESKIQLESIIGEEVHYFAYPNGKYKLDFDNVHIDMVRELGFKAAFSTDWGIAKLDLSSKYRLRRFTPWDKTLFRFCMRLIFNILAERSTIKFLLRRVRKHELS